MILLNTHFIILFSMNFNCIDANYKYFKALNSFFFFFMFRSSLELNQRNQSERKQKIK